MSGDSSEPTNVEGTKRNLDDDVKAASGTPSKRVRKSAVVFAPSVRKTDVKTNRVIVGRGKALGDIEACKASMDKSKLSSAEMNNAHKVLIGGGKPAKKDIRKNLRAFNGYLPKLEDGKTEKDVKVEDYTLKEKMRERANKFTIAQIKKVFDFLAIDRTKLQDKDSLINRLLDVLSSPSEKMTKGYAASSRKAAAKKKKKEEDDEMEDAEGKFPSDKALKRWANAYKECFNMEKSTLKSALQIASDKFGVDLKEKKALLKDFLTS